MERPPTRRDSSPDGGLLAQSPQAVPLTGRLPSGRELAVRSTPEGEQIEVRSASGDLELRIALTDAGPVLQLRGVRLEIDSTEAIALRCKELEVDAQAISMRAQKDVRIDAQGQMNIQTGGLTNIDAEIINLNCGDRSRYPDGQAALQASSVQAPQTPAIQPPPPASDGSCGCGHQH